MVLLSLCLVTSLNFEISAYLLPTTGKDLQTKIYPTSSTNSTGVNRELQEDRVSDYPLSKDT